MRKAIWHVIDTSPYHALDAFPNPTQISLVDVTRQQPRNKCDRHVTTRRLAHVDRFTGACIYTVYLAGKKAKPVFYWKEIKNIQDIYIPNHMT